MIPNVLNRHVQQVQEFITFLSRFENSLELYVGLCEYGMLGAIRPYTGCRILDERQNRKPKSSDKRREQEWFFGVFEESESGRKRKSNHMVKF